MPLRNFTPPTTKNDTPPNQRGAFAIAQRVESGSATNYRILAEGFSSLEQTLAAGPRVAAEHDCDLDEVVLLEVHDFWDFY